MKYSLCIAPNGMTTGYCDEDCLQRWYEGRGLGRRATPTDPYVCCVGCGKLLARRLLEGDG